MIHPALMQVPLERETWSLSLCADYKEGFWLYLTPESRRSLVLLGLAAYAFWPWYKQEQLYQVKPGILQPVYPASFASSRTSLGICSVQKFYPLLHQIQSLHWHLGAVKKCPVLFLVLFVFSLQFPVSWFFLTIWPLHPLALMFFFLPCNPLILSCLLLS